MELKDRTFLWMWWLVFKLLHCWRKIGKRKYMRFTRTCSCSKFILKISYKITAKTELNESCYRCRGTSDLQDKIIINGFWSLNCEKKVRISMVHEDQCFTLVIEDKNLFNFPLVKNGKEEWWSMLWKKVSFYIKLSVMGQYQ